MSDITHRLAMALVMSCTCLTKHPELRYHKKDCRYVAINDAMELIAKQDAEVERLQSELLDARHIIDRYKEQAGVRHCEQGHGYLLNWSDFCPLCKLDRCFETLKRICDEGALPFEDDMREAANETLMALWPERAVLTCQPHELPCDGNGDCEACKA